MSFFSSRRDLKAGYLEEMIRLVFIGIIFFALVSGTLISNCVRAEEATASRLRGNRLTYLDENDPFYVGLDFPHLATPQWIGEPDVEAVVVLAIDDMTEPE